MHNRRLAISKPHQFARSGKTDHGGGKAAAAWNGALANLTTLDEEGPAAATAPFYPIKPNKNFLFFLNPLKIKKLKKACTSPLIITRLNWRGKNPPNPHTKTPYGCSG